MSYIIELHKRRSKLPIYVNVGAFIYYEPEPEDEEHCRLLLYGNNTSNATASMIPLEESCNEVTEKLHTEEFIQEQHNLAVAVGIQQYVDFLQHEESNPLRDEYLRWKGMHELVSEKGKQDERL